MDSSFAERVHDLVAAIPPGQALSYGDVAEILEAGGPRQVAKAMAQGGPPGNPWWRVVRVDGSLPPRLAAAAVAEYRVEGTPVLVAQGSRIDMRRARWTPADAVLDHYRRGSSGDG